MLRLTSTLLLFGVACGQPMYHQPYQYQQPYQYRPQYVVAPPSYNDNSASSYNYGNSASQSDNSVNNRASNQYVDQYGDENRLVQHRNAFDDNSYSAADDFSNSQNNFNNNYDDQYRRSVATQNTRADERMVENIQRSGLTLAENSGSQNTLRHVDRSSNNEAVNNANYLNANDFSNRANNYDSYNQGNRYNTFNNNHNNYVEKPNYYGSYGGLNQGSWGLYGYGQHVGGGGGYKAYGSDNYDKKGGHHAVVYPQPTQRHYNQYNNMQGNYGYGGGSYGNSNTGYGMDSHNNAEALMGSEQRSSGNARNAWDASSLAQQAMAERLREESAASTNSVYRNEFNDAENRERDVSQASNSHREDEMRSSTGSTSANSVANSGSTRQQQAASSGSSSDSDAASNQHAAQSGESSNRYSASQAHAQSKSSAGAQQQQQRHATAKHASSKGGGHRRLDSSVKYRAQRHHAPPAAPKWDAPHSFDRAPRLSARQYYHQPPKSGSGGYGGWAVQQPAYYSPRPQKRQQFHQPPPRSVYPMYGQPQKYVPPQWQPTQQWQPAQYWAPPPPPPPGPLPQKEKTPVAPKKGKGKAPVAAAKPEPAKPASPKKHLKGDAAKKKADGKK